MTDGDEPSRAEGDPGLADVFADSPLDLRGETFCRTLVANASGGLLTIDGDGTIVFANPALERILGYSPEDLVGRPLLTLVPARLARDHRRAFRRYLGTGERRTDWDDVELPALHAEGHEVPVSISFREHARDGERLFTGVIRDVSERRRREAELERYEDIVTHLPEGIYRTEAEPDGSFLEANPALRDMLDVESVDALLRKGPADFYADPDERERLRERIREEGVLEDEELEVRTADGDLIWTSITAIEREEQGETYVDGVVEDVTERKERERELRERQRSIEAILSHIPGILFTLDEDGVFTRSEGETLRNIGLEPGEAVGQSVFDLYADNPAILDVCRRALDGEAVDDVVDAAGRTFEVTCRPIRDGEGDVERIVGFAYDVTGREERERELERQRTALERLRQVTESLRPLNRALARASTREEIERVVCEQLATTDAYLFAWYGDYNPASDRITPRMRAGVEDGYLDDFEVTADESDVGQGPAGRAVRTGDVRATREVLTDPAFEPWREDALARGYQSVAAVPVVFGETVYGVVAIYSGRPNAFDEHERGLLRELGERVGHAMHAAETERLLHTDAVEELEFRTTGAGSVLAGPTGELDCRLDLETVVPAAENAFVCYAAVDGTAPDAVADRLSDVPAVEATRVVDSIGTTGTVEYRLRSSLVTTLLDHGATVTSAVGEEGEVTVVAEVAPDADPRGIVADVRETYPETTLVAKRSIDRRTRTIDVSDDALSEALTDRQREVLTLAYHAGFFRSPRHSTGEELADALGISSPTFYRHVRKATQNVLEHIDRMGPLG